MSNPLKAFLTIALALLFGGGIAYRASQNRNVDAHNSATSSQIVPVNEPTIGVRVKVNGLRNRQKPGLQRTDPGIEAALAKIRAALEAPGRVELYPQPEMKKAIRELREGYREAIPILREALHGADLEARRRAAGGLAFLSIAAADAVPDLIEMLRDSTTMQDAIQAAAALQSIGVKAEAIPDLVNALDGNQHAREGVGAHFPAFLKEAAQKGADGGLLDSAVAKLTDDNDDSRLSGLSSIAGLGPVAIGAIPALKEFITQPNREDLKVFAEKLLGDLDTDSGREHDDPAWQQAQAEQAERARVFSEKARVGQATVPELITALRELPEAIPAAAQALGAIGYEEMSRRSHDNPRSNQEFVDATIMLTQIAASNQPLESRRAASEAFRELQPMQEKLLYTVDETSPAFAVISNALPSLSGLARVQVESRFNMMFEATRLMWTAQERSGEITDYQGSFLENYARELKKIDMRTYREFVAAMRKSDPKFQQQP